MRMPFPANPVEASVASAVTTQSLIPDIQEEERKDPELVPMLHYLQDGSLPKDEKAAKRRADSMTLSMVYCSMLSQAIGALLYPDNCAPISCRRLMTVEHILPRRKSMTAYIGVCGEKELGLMSVDIVEVAWFVRHVKASGGLSSLLCSLFQ